MLKHPDNPLITPAMVVPSHADLVVKGALNPGAVRCDDEVVLVLRIAEGGRQIADEVCVPRYGFVHGEATLEVLRLDVDDPDVQLQDHRAVVYRGEEHLSTLSHLRLARSGDGVHFVVDDQPFGLLPTSRKRSASKTPVSCRSTAGTTSATRRCLATPTARP